MSNSKIPQIGLGQARQLCRKPKAEVLAFLAEGMPIILESAESLVSAANALQNLPREQAILYGHANEEASKILILMDIIRCPDSRFAGTIGHSIKWFYHHGARLIYSNAISWRPVDISQLRQYVDRHRETHSLIGSGGEFISPNWALHEREALLYADVEAPVEGVLRWNSPLEFASGAYMQCDILDLVRSLSCLGLLSIQGIKVVSEVWNSVDFHSSEHVSDSNALVKQTLERLLELKIPKASATNEDVQNLYQYWQMPMYDFDFQEIKVSDEGLKDEQDRLRWQDAGYP